MPCIAGIELNQATVASVHWAPPLAIQTETVYAIRGWPQGLKPASLLVRDGMAEAMPFPVVFARRFVVVRTRSRSFPFGCAQGQDDNFGSG